VADCPWQGSLKPYSETASCPGCVGRHHAVGSQTPRQARMGMPMLDAAQPRLHGPVGTAAVATSPAVRTDDESKQVLGPMSATDMGSFKLHRVAITVQSVTAKRYRRMRRNYVKGPNSSLAPCQG
jgi:hypothetical protein